MFLSLSALGFICMMTVLLAMKGSVSHSLHPQLSLWTKAIFLGINAPVSYLLMSIADKLENPEKIMAYTIPAMILYWIIVGSVLGCFLYGFSKIFTRVRGTKDLRSTK